jgi:hypothetical protein
MNRVGYLRGRLALLATLMVGSVCLVAGGTGTAFADDNTGEFICQLNYVNSCFDLKNDSFTDGQQIYLWSDVSGQGGHGLGWNMYKLGTVSPSGPFSVAGLNTRYNGRPYYLIEKTVSTGGHNGCVTAGAPVTDIVWGPCDTTGSGDWFVYSSSHYLVNVLTSDLQSTQSVHPYAIATGSGNHGNGDRLYVDSVTDTGDFQWTWPGAP